MRKLLAAPLLLLPFANPAHAHPHVWVEMQSSLVVNASGMVSGFKVEWTFDDGYTQVATEGLDTDGDGSFSSMELEPLTKENISSLKEYEYFTVFRQKGTRLPVGEVSEFGQVYSDGKLKLYFSVPLAQPVDPQSGSIDIKVYDPDFFIAFDYVGDQPVALEGTLANSCAMTLEELKIDTELEQTREMLSEKDKDWKPEAEVDFGAMFARAVVVTCASS